MALAECGSKWARIGGNDVACPAGASPPPPPNALLGDVHGTRFASQAPT